MQTLVPHSRLTPDKGGLGGFCQGAGGGVVFSREEGDFLRKSVAMGYVPYDEALTEKARENRRNPTPAEKKLWFEVLRSRQLSGLKFTRQKPLDRYIVDFYCAELMLAVEIDGDNHVGRKRCDEVRTRRLNALGVEVVRYADAEVMNRVDGVYVDLLKRVSDMRTLSPTCRTPQPPLSRGL